MKLNRKMKCSTGIILLLLVVILFAAVGSVLNNKFLEGMEVMEVEASQPPPSQCNQPPPVPNQDPAYPAPPVPPTNTIVPITNVPGPPPPSDIPTADQINEQSMSGLASGLASTSPSDEYILKSQIVPPVCPACPACPPVKICPKSGAMDADSCPACPACSRCPEPAFECKKVPNYKSTGVDGYLPKPVLNDFSEF